MADEVQVFYIDLITRAGALNDTSTVLLRSQSGMVGADVGVENPAHRASLRLAMHSGFAQLATTLASAASDAMDLSSRLSAIAQRSDELDTELSGNA